MEFNFDLGVPDQESFIQQTKQLNVGDLLRKATRMYSDRVLVSEPGRDVTYEEFNERVNSLANALLERGYEKGEAKVAVLSENRGEFLEPIFAGAKLGYLVPALNWRLEREELIHCAELVDPDALIVSDRYREKAGWIEEEMDEPPEIIHLDGGDGDLEYETLIDDGSTDEPAPDYDVDPEQGLVVLYTSGTTGLPKGVVISHRAWLARGYTYVIDWEMQEGDGWLGWGPMFHIIAVDAMPGVLTLGGTYYPTDGFDTERIVDILLEDGGGIGWLYLLPGVINDFLDYIEENDVDVDEMRDIRAIGALVDLVDPKKVKRVTEMFDMPFKNSYGATEDANVLSAGNDIPVGVLPDDDDLAKAESSFVDLKLIDEEWNEVEGRGELAARGPTLSSGYINNPEANREDFNDGWFRTGDIFVYNEEDGTYSFVNRRKYLIKSGGENIYPAEIEKVLLQHQEIENATVVRVSDEKWGEVPRAVVSTYNPEQVTTDELMEMLRNEIANYKLPHYVEIVHPDDLPRSATGKIVREEVEDWEPDEENRVREV
ncbi:AMP-dependent synthetase and ligase (plasmid) [Haloterrigena turkmenica DSM 5511]|uniref:AMP-dependent synthetase and ligase n=1 Tax=Haloterrigena turkmenica (strain ATCC 51198 / DSM 5511 / JCM 9101 / NCIMB 13204 / VKM B-1734 / 4k) TaxID=543526 RepID=D2RZX6_HALTV|nr:class I adenylate-forming enzyme family protein [Haloterrigena turkmenica]ADB62673.1 AMP-dependent synthetase and ligase [Haloterrigena turkmenica DSM 5511]